jgi:hypothetical protein
MSVALDPGAMYVTGVVAGIVIVFVPLGNTIVIIFRPPFEPTVLTVEFAIIWDALATVLTVELAIMCVPPLSIFVKPSPVPRSAGAKMWTSVDTNVPSGCGTTVVPMNEPCVTLLSDELERPRNRVVRARDTVFSPMGVLITTDVAVTETTVPSRRVVFAMDWAGAAIGSSDTSNAAVMNSLSIRPLNAPVMKKV